MKLYDESSQLQLTSRSLTLLDGDSYKSHPGDRPQFVIQGCLFAVLGIALIVAIFILHRKIYKRRRQQIKGTATNEKDYEDHAIKVWERHEKELNATRAPTVVFEEDDDIVSPTFKLVQPKPPEFHIKGTSTNV